MMELPGAKDEELKPPEAPAAAAPPPPPAVALRSRTRSTLALAALHCGAAAVGGALPWHRVVEYGEESVLQGYHFAEGIVELAMGGCGFLLFLILQAKLGPGVRRMAAGAAALCAFGVAVAPLELFARASWAGVRTVIIVGYGATSYTGWAYGLYLSLVAGFITAGLGSVAVSPFFGAPRTVAVVRRSARRAPRA